MERVRKDDELRNKKCYIACEVMKHAVILSLFLCATARLQAIDPLLALDNTIPLPGVEGRIDHMAVDIAGQRLFVAALENNTVEVLDLKTGELIRSLPGFAQPQGMVYVPEFGKLFVANGADGTCRMLDGHSFETLKSLDLGDDAGSVRYDEAEKKVYVGYGSGLAAIDAKTGAKIADIPLAAHPESFRMETNSPNLYVNIPEAGQIAVVDRSKGTVTTNWPVNEARGNFPMSLDEANNRLFVGFRKPGALLVYNYVNGRLLAYLPIPHDADDVFYDERNKLIYVSCGDGTVEIIRQIDVDNYLKTKHVSTMPDARTSLFIPELNRLYVAVPRQSRDEPAEILVFKTPSTAPEKSSSAELSARAKSFSAASGQIMVTSDK
jgi:DNA-binding beta-propeller fold protein YncE